MLVNKDLNLIMRTRGIRNVREQNESGMILAICLIIALTWVAAIFIK